jgi:extracellular factor (EF) 3-hydroxypalmitic acid methyl ester biosynthesis protein
MSMVVNGNGNGNGAGGLARQLDKKVASRPAAASFGVKETRVTFQTHEEVELRGTLVRTTRLAVVFELYNPIVTPRLSEALEGFKIIFQERLIYSGRAIIRNVVDAGTKIVCEATLDESHWSEVDSSLLVERDGQISDEFQIFLREWQKLYKVSPEFKVVVADMQSFLQDLRLWLDQVELGVQAQPARKREELERKILEALQAPALTSLASLFEKFERLITKIEKESQSAHSLYAKRALHPLVLCAPFMHRTYEKPLGYAGDYEMVSMMTRNPFEGGSFYAKILNAFFLNTPPVVAHRNRLDYLTRSLIAEVYRVKQRRRKARVFNLGCGPAVEIQRFLAKATANQNAEFTLLDFNDETVAQTQLKLNQLISEHGSGSTIQVIKKSVMQLLRSRSQFEDSHYDLVYCAGLFDYLQDPVCIKLVELFYELAAPGGLVLVTNVDASNPSRGWMECMVDWHLVYRNARQMNGLLPKWLPKDLTHVIAEPTSVNIFAEIRKPENA